VRRNYVVYRSEWLVFLTGFAEPVLYLFSIGIGVGQLIDGFRLNGHTVTYAAFVAPGMLAASAMNGALLDSTYGIFFKLRYDYVQLAVVPMFLLSATFFPVTTFHGVLRWVVEATPLYRGVALVRELTVGAVTTDSLWSVLYLLVMGSMGLLVAARRFDRLLLH